MTRQLTIGECCAGYGGLSMAVEEVFNARPVWFAEYDPAPSKVLAHHWPTVPNHGDMTTIDWAAVEPVDIISGGSPCTDLSHAGKRAGMFEGTRSNLWVQMREAIAIIKPTYVVWENVQGALSAAADSELERTEGLLGVGRPGPYLRAAGRVVGDLASLGYLSAWHGLTAASIGAPHGRYRVFLLAWLATDADGVGCERGGGTRQRGDGPTDLGESAADTAGDGRDEGWAESAGFVGGSDVAVGGDAVADTAVSERGGPQLQHLGAEPDATAELGERDREGAFGGGVDWGQYEPAIRRWEHVLNRPAPRPTELSKKGGQRLSAPFVEFLMGVPAGHVTDPAIGLTRNEQLKCLGNGVVKQQAVAALRHLLDVTGGVRA